jgi:hypothetical protein
MDVKQGRWQEKQSGFQVDEVFQQGGVMIIAKIMFVLCLSIAATCFLFVIIGTLITIQEIASNTIKILEELEKRHKK